MGQSMLRSVFDQYSQRENGLSHALSQVLSQDQRAVREFVDFANPPPAAALSISCQVRPGDPQGLLAEPDANGLPDVWIFDVAESWAVLVEAKVTAALTAAQLRRHIATARRHGFEHVHLLVITADLEEPVKLRALANELPWSWRSWTDVYTFFTSRRWGNPVSAFLAGEFAAYLRATEARLMNETNAEKVLTKFQGIPFGDRHPFNEAEARVLLRALVRDLRRELPRSRLPVAARQNAKPLTGLWDVITFDFAGAEAFTNHPHLTIGMHPDDVQIQLTLPNGARADYWKRLRDGTASDLSDVLSEVVRAQGKRKTAGKTDEPQIQLELLQRHFQAQRLGFVDGALTFRLDVLGMGAASSLGVKQLPAWLDAVHLILSESRRANVQVSLQARFPFHERSVCRKPELVPQLVAAAEAFAPFLNFIRGL